MKNRLITSSEAKKFVKGIVENIKIPVRIFSRTKHYFICPLCKQENEVIESGMFRATEQKCRKCGQEVKLID